MGLRVLGFGLSSISGHQDGGFCGFWGLRACGVRIFEVAACRVEGFRSSELNSTGHESLKP